MQEKDRPYLLTLSSHTDGMDRFLDSLKKAGDLEHIVVQFKPYTKGLRSLVKIDLEYPGHIEKWKYVPDGLDPERYVVFTDTDDVVFQKELPEFGEFDLYLAPENAMHRGGWWEKYIEEHPVFEPLLDKPIYCSGTWAMKVKHLYDLLDFQQEIGIFGNLYQCYFNLFLLRHPELTRYEDLCLFLSLHANIHNPAVKKVNGLWTYNEEPVVCVHSNGSMNDRL